MNDIVDAAAVSGERRQVVVAGGGSAGSAVATLLAQRGVDVLLLDAARFPRDKVCGEGVSPEAWRLVSPDGHSFRGHYPEGRDGFALRRLALDAALLAAAREAGAEVREGVRVTAPWQDDGAVAGVSCETPAGRRLVRARVVVAADGRAGVVARRLGLLREHPRLRRFAVRGYWEGAQGLESFGEMHVAARGYCGIAPLSPARANVTFVLDASEMSPAAGDLKGLADAIAQRLSRRPDLADRLVGVAGDFVPARTAFGPGFLLRLLLA